MIETAACLLYERGEVTARALAGDSGRKPRVALINGLPHASLSRLADFAAELIVQQTRRDDCLALQRAGLKVRRAISGADFDLVLVTGGRQREQTLGRVAGGIGLMDAQAPYGGTLLFVSANDMGAKGYEKRMRGLGASLSVSSKSRCRVVKLHGADIAHPDLVRDWCEAAAPRRLESGLVSCPGVFSWDRPDAGSKLLLKCLPERLFEAMQGGRGLDLGCGNGYLSVHMLHKAPGMREWHAVDVDAGALECARQNLEGLAPVCSVYTHWLDATRESLPGSMDLVLLNPPFHKDKADNNALGHAMITAAARSMRPTGSLYLVANRHLPYEMLLFETFEGVKVLFEGEGYKVLRCEGIR